MARLGPFGRSTLLRHTVLALLGVGLLYLLVIGLSDYRNSQLGPIAYTACAAGGLTLLIGLSGQISLGHGAFMLVGGYTVALLLPHWQSNVGLFVFLAAGAVVAAAFGGIVGIAAARLRGPYLAGATLALAIGLPKLPSYEHLRGTLGGAQGLAVNPPTNPSGIDYYRWQTLVCCICAVVVFWFLANVMNSRLGRSMRAVRDDEIAAALSGLPVARIQVLAFVISAACAGVGGGLLAYINSNAGQNAFGLQISLNLLAVVVIGGLGTLGGAVWGSILVVMLGNYWGNDLAKALSIHSDKVANNLPNLIFGVLLAGAMLVAPGGIQGTVRQAFVAARDRTRR